jgi:acetyltransferase-like isoleucine patch superfamily enzyme
MNLTPFIKYFKLPLIIISNKVELLYAKLLKFNYQLQGVEFGNKTMFYGKPHIRILTNTQIKIGNNCRFRSSHTSNLIGINRPCILSTHGGNHNKILIGNNCGFSGTVIGAFTQITIGNNVKCGANTLITDSDWHQEDPRSGPPKPIVIGDNVWLGVNAVVLKGVTIGENTVIGANSLVVKDIPANVIAAGNPCKVIKVLQ